MNTINNINFTSFLKILFSCLFFISLSVQAETIDSCLVGLWKTNPALQKKTVTKFTGQPVSKITGTVLMRIDANGNGKYQLKNVAIKSPAAESSDITVRLNGISRFTWRTINNNFSAESTDSAIQVSATAKFGDMEIPLPEVPFNNGQWPEGRGQARYICTSKQLQFDFEHKEKLITILWQRL